MGYRNNNSKKGCLFCAVGWLLIVGVWVYGSGLLSGGGTGMLPYILVLAALDGVWWYRWMAYDRKK